MGKNNGYKLLLDAESYDNSRFGMPEKGLEVALTHHLDIPVMSHSGILLPSGYGSTTSDFFDIDNSLIIFLWCFRLRY